MRPPLVVRSGSSCVIAADGPQVTPSEQGLQHKSPADVGDYCISTQFESSLSSPVRLMGERIRRPIKISKELLTIVNQIKLMDHVM